jgi:DNA ligase-4
MPHIHIYFTVSYGLSRDELEEVNFLLKNSDSVPYGDAALVFCPHLNASIV